MNNENVTTAPDLTLLLATLDHMFEKAWGVFCVREEFNGTGGFLKEAADEQ